MSSIIYLTFDGLLQPLGESQVVRVLERLSKRGFSYSIVSLERPADLANLERVDSLRRRLGSVGIDWFPAEYRQSMQAKVGGNFWRAARLVRQGLKDGAQLIHARGYHSAFIARVVGMQYKVPYLFDARGRWVDERLLQGRWFSHNGALKAARRVERQLYESAAGVVTLTNTHKQDVLGGDLARVSSPVVNIPTCADYSIFERAMRAKEREPNAPLRLLVSGSFKPMCHHEEGLDIARMVLERREDAELVILSSEYRVLRELAVNRGIPSERITATSAQAEEMPGWLASCDWAIHLVSTAKCNRGMYPTKLAEFFAAGVRPLHYGCNDDVVARVEDAQTGLVLRSLDSDELARGAAFIASAGQGSQELLDRGRQKTRPFLDIEFAVNGYQELLHKLMQDE